MGQRLMGQGLMGLEGLMAQGLMRLEGRKAWGGMGSTLPLLTAQARC